ncbi:hypothetical protein ACHAWF_001575 [Thalassiosira exigua]
MPLAKANTELLLPAAAFAAGVFAASLLHRQRHRRPRSLQWTSTHTLPKCGTRVRLRSGTSADIGAAYGQTRALAVLHDEVESLLESEEDVRQAFEDGGFHVLIAESIDTGEAIGSATVQDIYRTWTGPSLYLQDLLVDEAHRGKGIGTLLMRTVAAIAVRRGCNLLFWESHAGNAEANGFYSECIGGETATGEHRIITWKIMGTDKLENCAKNLEME